MFTRMVDRKPPILLDSLAILFFVLLGLVVFSPELFLGLKVVDGDLYRQVVPTTAWYGRVARQGGNFLWTPGILGGFPIAFTQYSLFFPLDWIAARLLDPDRAVALSFALHLPLAGIATYFYGRSTRLSRLSSLMAGVGYQLSTESLALGIGGYLLRSLFLLPVLLLCIELIIQRSWRWALLAAAAAGVSLLSGTAYIVAIAVLNAGIYTLARGLWLWRKGLRERALLLLGSMGGAVLVGTGLAAVRVLPTLAITAQSVRSNGLPFSIAAGGSVSPGVLVLSYLLPLTRVFGIGVNGIGDVPSYVGPLVLALAVIAMFRCRRSPWTRIFMWALLFNLLGSLGKNAPVFGLIHRLPLFADFRNVSRFSVFSAFFFSMLAAQALDGQGATQQWSVRWRVCLRVATVLATVLFVLAIFVGVLWMYGGEFGAGIRLVAQQEHLGPMNPLRPRMIIALVAIPAAIWLVHLWAANKISKTAMQAISIAATSCVLLTFGIAMLQFRAPDPGPPATARFLQSDHSLFRVMSYWPNMSVYLYLQFLAGGKRDSVDAWGPAEQDFAYRYMRESLAPNFPLEYGLDSIDGYEVLQSKRQAIAMKYFGSEKAEEIPVDREGSSTETWDLAAKLEQVGDRGIMDRISVFRAFNVKYVLTNLQLWQHSKELRLAFTKQIPMLDPRTMTSVYVYEVIGALPRAYLVPDSVTARNETEALDWIISGQLNPSSEVAIENPEGLKLSEARLDPSRSSVSVISYTGSQINLRVRADGSGFLVINDAYYPGWRSWVDGKETPILIANGWVRAIQIPSAGDHTVRLAYAPPLFSKGRWVSIGSLTLCAVGLLLSLPRWLRRRGQ